MIFKKLFMNCTKWNVTLQKIPDLVTFIHYRKLYMFKFQMQFSTTDKWPDIAKSEI